MGFYGIQPSFAGGELSAALYGRVDMAKYSVGLARCRNAFVHAYGGVSNRPGTEFVSEVKDSSKRVRLTFFQYSTQAAYVLEFGHGYIRFYTDGYRIESSGVPVEVASPYTEEMLSELNFVQSADVLFIVHPDVRPKMLSRYSHTSWTLTDFDFKNGPFMDMNVTDTTVWASGVTGGVTLTASSPLFKAGHVGGLIRIGADVAGYTSMGIPNAPAYSWEFNRQWPQGSFCTHKGRMWRALDGYRESGVETSKREPGADSIWERVSDTEGLEIVAYKSWDLQTSGFWRGTIYLERWDEDAGLWKEVRSYSSAASSSSNSSGAKNFNEGGDVEEPTRFRIRSSSFAQVVPDGGGDVDRGYVSLIASGGEFYGTARVTAVSSEFSASAEVLTRLPDASATKLWAFGAWSGENGWPSSIGFFNQRMVFGATRRQPQTLWFSRPDLYQDFSTTIPTADDDAISITLVAEQVNAIRHIVGMSDLLVFTAASEWRISPGDSPFTPSNAPARVQSYYGASAVSPVLVGNIVLFVQNQGSTLRNFGYMLESDGYKGTDLSVLAKHLLEGRTLVSMALQREPWGVLWCVRDDGALAGLTYLPEHDVMAWHLHTTQGAFESVASIPGAVQDEVWFVVRRTVNGVTKRYVERLAHRLPDGDLKRAIFLDSALSYHGAEKLSSFGGLSHLEGMAVSALADGFVVSGLVVKDGKVSLKHAASDVTIGLPYVSEVKTLRMEMGLKDGSMQARYKAISRLFIRVEKTLGGRVGDNEGSILDEPKYRSDEAYGCHTRLRTGDIELSFPGGFNRAGQIYFRQEEPLPFTILAFIPEVTVGG